ncbi:hypothetical protein AB0H88_08080 [Nonomuraea sp. NPDC050680]|uniref:hypothetical protein n=1 Tax=Nonomuraea sp. NPDC050680 TaxID=3154630 RepID=UPI0033CDF6F0
MMGWLDAALSVGTTIGKIAGALQGSPGAMTHIGPIGNGINPKIGQVIFWLDEFNHIWAVNQSDDQVGVYFPGAKGGMPEGDNYTIAAHSKFPISGAFNTYSLADVDEFVVTPFKSNGSAGLGNGEGNNTIQASASNQPANVEFKVGAFIRMRVSGSERLAMVTVVGGLALAGIVLFTIRGAGRTQGQLSNLEPPESANGGVTSMTIPLPAGVDVSAGVSFVDITVSVQNMQPLLAKLAHEKAGLMVPLTKEDHQRIAAYAGP